VWLVAPTTEKLNSCIAMAPRGRSLRSWILDEDDEGEASDAQLR
jgi:hypothetical protein